jgi:hypothetical protein
VCVDAPRHEGIAVGSAVRMPEAERASALAVDEQLAAMGGSVVSRAQGQKIGRLVATAFGARLDMVHVDERRVGAARHRASVSIAREHGAPQRGRDTLPGAARTDLGAGGSLRPGRVGRVALWPALGAHVGVVCAHVGVV